MKKIFTACLIVFSTLALAQDRPPPDGKGPPPGMDGKGPPPGLDGKGPPDVAKLLNIDANRAEKVQAILRASHEQRMALRNSVEGGQQGDRSAMREKMRALRDDTHKKLAAILSADELKKLEATMPPPPPPPKGAGAQG